MLHTCIYTYIFLTKGSHFYSIYVCIYMYDGCLDENGASLGNTVMFVECLSDVVS